jgi:hypothetical protein|tara:strand:- start:254 stop:661 length:408 start_codon:yes stop_codon:yes gene_type:complete
MKLTKQSLRQMIKEAYKDGKPDLNRKGKSRGQQSKELRQTAKDVADGTVGGEFTPIERSLVQQISQVITDIAAAPDVDLGQFRAQLNTILQRLVKITDADLDGVAAQGEDKPDAKAKADADAKPAGQQELGQQEL